MAEYDFEDGGDGVLIEDGEPVSVEDRARAMGWKPKAEYRGDPRRWTDAEEFIAHGEAELPILRDQSRRMSEKLARAEGELNTLRNTVSEQTMAIQDAMKLAQRADERGYQRGIAELKAKQREAVAIGDMEAYDQTEQQIQAAERERAIVETPAPVAPAPQPEPEPEVQQFVAANPWFEAKPILKRAMIDAHSAIVQSEGIAKGRALVDQFERAKAEVVDAFPQYFPTEGDDDEPRRARPRLRAAGTLEPSGVVPMRRRGASPFDRIEDMNERKEAKDAYDRMVRLNNTDMTAEEYISLYTGEQQDVLAMRAARKKA